MTNKYDDLSKEQLIRELVRKDEVIQRSKGYTPKQMVDSIDDSEIFRALYQANLSRVNVVIFELSCRGHPTAYASDGYTDKDELFYKTLMEERLDRLVADGKITKSDTRYYPDCYCLYSGKEYLE